ncbi:hypothetical protein [Erwinia oleae]|uniref:hypothetical protein n=1 Tax=Erwinia oleae TaxID=796334 RepID=UPI000AA5D35B|nr:hypothetical protein [Erwinia oleae]
MLAEHAVTLSAPEGGVWQDAGQRADYQDSVQHVPIQQDNTLADVLAQHSLQQHTA